MEYTLFTRNQYCPWCDRAKEFLDTHGILYKNRIVGVDIDRDFFISLLPSEKQERPTVPQLFSPDGGYIGGYDELVIYFSQLEKKTDIVK